MRFPPMMSTTKSIFKQGSGTTTRRTTGCPCGGCSSRTLGHTGGQWGSATIGCSTSWSSFQLTMMVTLLMSRECDSKRRKFKGSFASYDFLAQTVQTVRRPINFYQFSTKPGDRHGVRAVWGFLPRFFQATADEKVDCLASLDHLFSCYFLKVFPERHREVDLEGAFTEWK